MKETKEKARAGDGTDRNTDSSYPNYTKIGDVAQVFSEHMAEHGVAFTEPVIADGRLRRVQVNGDKQGTRNGWYVLHADGIPAGCGGSWRNGEPIRWCAKAEHEMTAEQRRAHQDRLAEQTAQRDREREAEYAQGRKDAQKQWDAADPATHHTYLEDKDVGAYGVRVDDSGALLIPVADADGNLHGLQRIAPNGSKRFTKHTRKRGNFHVIGSIESAPKVVVVEGYATGASVHEATRLPVVISFDAGNLLPVSQTMRTRLPGATLLIAGDDDRENETNTGRVEAERAADAVGGTSLFPPFQHDTPGTDWNDYSTFHGVDAVRAAFEVQDPSWHPMDIRRAMLTVPPPIDWILDRQLAAGQMGCIVGQGGCGKSFFTLSLCCAIATGETIFPSFTPTRPRRVLYLSAEDPEDILWRRIRHVAPMLDLDRLATNLHIIPGLAEPLVAETAAGMQREPRYAWLREQAKQYDLIVLDPMSRWHGMEENSATAMSFFVQAITELTHIGAAVIVIHHTSKAGSDGASSDSSRGSSALRDGFRWFMTMAEPTAAIQTDLGISNPKLFVAARLVKANYVQAQNDVMLFQRGDHGVLEEVDPQDMRESAQAGQKAGVERVILDVVHTHDPQPPHGWATDRKLIQNIKSAIGRTPKRDEIRGAIDRLIECEKLTINKIATNGRAKNVVILSEQYHV